MVDRASFENGQASAEKLQCYTDGSKTRAGFGAATLLKYRGEIISQRVLPLGQMSSVFIAEVFAIFITCVMAMNIAVHEQIVKRQEEVIKTIREDGIIIYSDSMAALMALDKPDIKSKL